MQIRKIVFTLALLVHSVPSNLVAIRLKDEYLATQKTLGTNYKGDVILVQEKSQEAINAANAVNFFVPKLEELVSLIPNKTFKEIPLPKIPHIIEKNISITTQGLVKMGLGIVATIKKARDPKFIAEIINEKYGHYDLKKVGIAERKEIRAEVNKQIAKQWAYDIVKSHCVDKIYAFLQQKELIPTFGQDTPENKAKSFFLQCYIKQGIDMGIDISLNYACSIAAKAIKK